MPYWTLLTGYTVDLVAFVELSPQTKAAQPFEIAVTRLPFERDLLGELLVLDWQVALDGTGLGALLVCQPLGVWTYSGGATMTAGLKETPRLTIDDWLRRSEEQGDLGLIQRLSMQVRRPDLGRADRAEGIQEGHMKVPLSPTKSLFPFRAGSSGRTILHEFKEKPVEPTTLRQPEEKPTGHTTASKPK